MTTAATNTVKKAKKQPEAQPPAFGLGLITSAIFRAFLNQPEAGGMLPGRSICRSI